MSQIHTDLGSVWVNYRSRMDNMVELLRQKDPKLFHQLGMRIKILVQGNKTYPTNELMKALTKCNLLFPCLELAPTREVDHQAKYTLCMPLVRIC